MRRTYPRALLLVPFIVACASTPGARPEASSAADHEAQARKHDAEMNDCKNQVPPLGSVCWSSVAQPSSDKVLERTEMHHKMAADHRAASATLRDAESRACAGISESDRDQSPFEHREDLVSVEPLFVHPVKSDGSQALGSAVGASLKFRALPGMTTEWLQRVIECHTARNAAMGYAMPEMKDCPLMLKGVTATVSSTGDGFAVAVRSDDVETAIEIQKRAKELAPQ
jgi:hypothetical protein